MGAGEGGKALKELEEGPVQFERELEESVGEGERALEESSGDES